MSASVGEQSDHVSQIQAVRGAKGGKYIEDRFRVESTDAVKQLVGPFNKVHGHGSLILRPELTAVYLGPPIEFVFKTTREAPDGCMPRTELIITGHFITVVDRKDMGQEPCFQFDEERCDYQQIAKDGYKLAVAEAAIELGTEIMPPHLMSFFQDVLQASEVDSSDEG